MSVADEIHSDCSFSIGLKPGSSYNIAFVKGDEFIASLIFAGDDTDFQSSFFTLSNDTSLGTITLSGNIASPENNPLEQNDSDEDGQNDMLDQDDDNDGVKDSEERDCDLDGFTDDVDEDDSSCDFGNDNEAAPKGSILKAEPRHQEVNVDLDEDVKVKFACLVDQSSVTANSFIIEKADGSGTIPCQFEFDTSHDDAYSKIECEHDGQDFATSSEYQAKIDGVKCLDGTSVDSKTWTFSTESKREDQDDEDENENESEDESENESEDESENESEDESEDHV